MTFGRENNYSLGKLLCPSELCCVTEALFSKGNILVGIVLQNVLRFLRMKGRFWGFFCLRLISHNFRKAHVK